MKPEVIFIIVISGVFLTVLGVCFSYIMELKHTIKDQEKRLSDSFKHIGNLYYKVKTLSDGNTKLRN